MKPCQPSAHHWLPGFLCSPPGLGAGASQGARANAMTQIWKQCHLRVGWHRKPFCCLMPHGEPTQLKIGQRALLFISFFFNFIFKLYNIVLVLPNIEMNLPQVFCKFFSTFFSHLMLYHANHPLVLYRDFKASFLI